jgi:hypothetical protein
MIPRGTPCAGVPGKGSTVLAQSARRAGCPRLQMGLASPPLAGPLELLALGPLRSEWLVSLRPKLPSAG